MAAAQTCANQRIIDQICTGYSPNRLMLKKVCYAPFSSYLATLEVTAPKNR